MIKGWEKHYCQKPVIIGNFDMYTITFPLTTNTTINTTIKTTIKTTTNKEYEILEIIKNNGLMEEQIDKGYKLTKEGKIKKM